MNFAEYRLIRKFEDDNADNTYDNQRNDFIPRYHSAGQLGNKRSADLKITFQVLTRIWQ
jgi:hypothetical protein